MKKWLKYIFFSFFSHKTAKEGARRGYANVFLSLVLALVFLWAGMVSAETLPMGAHYNNSPDFTATVHAVFANDDVHKRIDVKIEDGVIRAKKHGGEYSEGLFVNTFENDADKQNYSVNGYNIVVDTRPADTLAEFEAYYISNDGENTVISYEDYLTLSDVAKRNFDFKLKYTGNELELTDEAVGGYLSYINGLDDENKNAAKKLAADLDGAKITKDEYQRGIYELYFKNYYPEITAYESVSAVPLLRNYYHQYINEDTKNYLLVFDDYMTGSFETVMGIEVSFHSFYSDLENGDLIAEGASQEEAESSVDRFIKKSFNAMLPINLYVHAVNILSLTPFIALMLMVVTLLTYSILKLRNVESIKTLGSMLKIVGSFVWFSGVISAVLTVVMSFFISRSLIGILPSVLFFAVLIIRAIVFTIKESKLFSKQLEQQSAQRTGD